MNSSTLWKIKIELCEPEFQINIDNSNCSRDAKTITFDSISATSEEIDSLINKAQDRDNMFHLIFPKGYRLSHFCVPYPNIQFCEVLEMVDEPEISVEDQVDKILSKE